MALIYEAISCALKPTVFELCSVTDEERQPLCYPISGVAMNLSGFLSLRLADKSLDVAKRTFGAGFTCASQSAFGFRHLGEL